MNLFNKSHMTVHQILTRDFPNCAEHIEFFWIQSFNVVIDVPVNDNRTLEWHITTNKEHGICIFCILYQADKTWEKGGIKLLRQRVWLFKTKTFLFFFWWWWGGFKCIKILAKHFFFYPDMKLFILFILRLSLESRQSLLQTKFCKKFLVHFL